MAEAKPEVAPDPRRRRRRRCPRPELGQPEIYWKAEVQVNNNIKIAQFFHVFATILPRFPYSF